MIGSPRLTDAAGWHGAPVTAVLFDVHTTLLGQVESGWWLDHAWASLGRSGSPQDVLGAAGTVALVANLDTMWEHAREVDPESRRDLDHAAHEQTFIDIVAGIYGVERALCDALYATLADTWLAYDDAVPTLRALKEAGFQVGALSNIGFDSRSMLERAGVLAYLDATVFSFEVGAVKPDPAIFAAALAALNVTAEQTLMVGDSWRDDAGGAELGIRTLILPRTSGAIHGLLPVVDFAEATRR